jgi:hypothetical protein
MLKKMGSLLFVVVLVFSLSPPVFAKGDKQDRVEGHVVRTGKSTLTVRVRDTGTEKTVYYDDSTKWGSQYHGSKKVDAIQPSDVKDGDQVICLGSYDDKGQFHATDISKRLSHSPK